MTNSITTETIKILAHPSFVDILCLIIFIVIGLIMFVGGVATILDYNAFVGYLGIIVSLTIALTTAVTVVNWSVPFNVTEKTQRQQEKVQIIQTEGKLLSSDGLTLFLKDSQGKYSKKNISVDGDRDVKFKEEGNSYIYTQVKTKVTYITKHKIRAILIFDEFPRDKSTTEIILTVPKGTLTQNKSFTK
ncbi:hypothetical protein OGZ51_12330 [Lactococcus lactis]|uniref:Uncharacterized protein n=1 Tax=Lactococcus lactis TaxID=1358 RepID=A0A9X4NJI9_9LACT|nr:hypothetical protein [Lactococcus lactis]MDG4984932.1 hypothetical protein [Lactococcus lactis]